MRSKKIRKQNSVHGSNHAARIAMTFAYDTRITRYQLKVALKCRVNVSAH